MTDTLISLISILIGIIGANFLGSFLPKYSFGLIGNCIAGVFGSVFLIKSIGRLGFDPVSIMKTGDMNLNLFLVNSLVSFIGGALAVILIQKIRNKMDKT